MFPGSLTVLSQTHDCLVVLARRGPQDLALPPGSCISISRPGESAQSLDNLDQHSLEYMYSSAVRPPSWVTGNGCQLAAWGVGTAIL